MEKIIEIGGRATRFKSNGTALLIYKAQTGRNLIPDLISLVKGVDSEKLSNGDLRPEDLQSFDPEIFYGICWTFDRIADPSIPPIYEWVESFDAFPFIDVFTEVVPLLMECITCSAEVKNVAATAGLTKKANRSKQSRLFSWRRK